MGARPSVANRRERLLQAVQLGGPENLAGEARGAPGDGQHVELAFLLVGGRRQPRHPRLVDIDMAGWTWQVAHSQAPHRPSIGSFQSPDGSPSPASPPGPQAYGAFPR